MRIFLDSTNIDEIKKFNNYGIIDGITTNPSMIAGAGKDFKEITSEICSNTSGDVSIEVAANDYGMMIEEGKKIASIAKNAVVKLPLTWDGIKACKYFADNKIKVNMTLCFSAGQALMAAKAGATYVSPFIGRLEDQGGDGISLISKIRSIYNNYGFATQILAASIRKPEHVIEAALNGADAVTLPIKIIASILDHDLTKIGLEKFNRDWNKSGMKI